MNIEKGKLLSYLDPSNFKLKTKIQFIIFSSVFITILVTIVLGFSMFRNIILKSTLKQLEELTYLKSSEIEQKFKITGEKLIYFSKASELIEASEKFNTGFHTLKDEKSNLLFTDSLKFIRDALDLYYNKDVSINYPLTGSQITNYLPSNDNGLIAQYLFTLRLNPNLPGDKGKISSFSDNSSYSQIHASYHPYLENICSSLDAKDLYLIDPMTGDVVYSLNKNIDFSSNLYSGRLRISPLSTVFRTALAVNRPVVSFVDYSIYAPAMDQPVAFLSIPVYSSNKLISVMVIQLGTSFLEHTLFDEYMLSTDGSLEYNVIGKDLYLRNNSRGFLADEKNYLRSLEKHATRKEVAKILLYKSIHNMAMLAQYPAQDRVNLLSEENMDFKDYLETNVLASVKQIEVFGNELYLIAKIDRIDALSSYLKLIRIFTLLSIILLIGIYLTGKYFSESLKNRIIHLRNSMISLYRGEEPKLLDPINADEIGESVDAYNDLRKRINEASEFAIEMSEGNFNHEFALISESDSLGKSLNELKIKMIQSKKEQDQRQREDEIRNWINNGIAKFNDLLRQNNNNIEALSYSLIENLVTYIGANQGGVFLVEGDHESEKTIKLVASYAYDRRKYNKKTIEIGEGLLGNIYLEKKSIYLKDLPEDYMEIKSGLGQGSPRSLYITSLKVDETVLGMIEIGSLNEFEPHHIELLEKVSESIAGTFISVRLNMQTTKLLDESNRRSEEISQQEEEMRQNLEEMQATQEELARSRQEDDKRTREMQIMIDNARRMLKNIMEAIPGGYILKDNNGIILLANQEGAAYYGESAEMVLGKTDYELLNADMFETEHKADFEVISKGEKQYTETKDLNGEKKTYKVIKKPFSIEEMHQMGILTIRYQTDD
jgi:PAS domain S-box-containing protein